MHLRSALFCTLLLSSATMVSAQEGLEDFTGTWRGGGEYVRLNGDRVNVECTMNGEGGATSLTMSGRCTALGFITRDISAAVKEDGSRISGQYVGPEGGGAVQGERTGNTLNLAIQWQRPVRGNMTADLRIEITPSGALEIRTFEADPKTKSTVTVTDLRLQRQ